MKSILVATDLSERSDRAVRRALRLAQEQGATCHALCVIDESLPADLAKPLLADTEAKLTRFVERYCEGASYKISVMMGDVRAAVPAKAEETSADLVVLGVHRERAFLELLRETTMEALVRAIGTPVLLVKDPADHDYAQVLAPVSFSPACASALRIVPQIAPEAAIHAFHALHLPFAGLTGDRPGGATDKVLTREAEGFRAAWVTSQELPETLSTVEITSGSLSEVFGRRLDAVRPDLVVLGAHTRSGLALYSIGSFAANLVRRPPCDVLIARPKSI